MKKKIVSIIGTRPEIIKMYPLIKEFDKNFNQTIIFSGQHFSKNMASNIFQDLKLRKPDINIKIKNRKNFLFEFSKKLIKNLKKLNPDFIVYHGDTFTTLISAFVSVNFFPEVKNVHIESGYRSNAKDNIEEKIRKVADKYSEINFAIRKKEKKNLFYEGVKKNVYTVGNTINDIINLKKKIIKKININNKYLYVTIHRSENVDKKERFMKIHEFLNKIASKIDIILSIHPRSKKMQKRYNLKLSKKIKIISPVKYTNNLKYLYNSFFCITDSGGIQEEAILLGKKCFIPLSKTPHDHYLKKDANELISLDDTKRLFSFLNKKKIKVKKFDHTKSVSKRICKILLEL